MQQRDDDLTASGQPAGLCRYLIGIDLGTTNCALAYIDTREGTAAKAKVLAIPQWETEGSTVQAQTLPSFYYLPPKAEHKRGQLALPWQANSQPDYAVGRLARWKSSQVPGRVIHQAKSWLCHPGVDREARILPWHVGELIGEERRSPVEVSAAYLAHLRDAWNFVVATDDTESCFELQDITITVPASFDEVAQRLTLAAALQAGYPERHLRLLEEPQAAFYHWLSTQARSLPAEVKTVLIVDIGGGTSDFSLFQADRDASGQPSIKRLAVSEHLLLGGDNIDLSLAHQLEAKLVAPGQKLSSRSWAELVFATRKLKEKALGVAADAVGDAEPLDATTTGEGEDEALFVSIAGEGAGLFASSRTASMTRGAIRAHVVSGFMPEVARDAAPLKQRTALLQLGLPYAQDSAITKHLAQFLAGREVDAVLCNGGTLKPALLQERLVQQIAAWQGFEPRVLPNPAMDLAVALGAAEHGRAQRQPALRIGGGYARSLYLEVATATGSKFVCIVPKGYEGTTALKVTGLDLKLRTDHPARFQVYSSLRRSGDQVGAVVDLAIDELHALPPVTTRLEFGGKGAAPKLVDVSLEIKLADTGVLYLYCVHQSPGAETRRWQLDFNVRATHSTAAVANTVAAAAAVPVPQPKMALVVDKLDLLYGKKKRDGELAAPKNLIREFEEMLGSTREQWETPTLRALWPHLEAGMTRRSRSLSHEMQWLYLAGYALRPGYGYELDEWRVAELWRCYEHGLSFAKEKQAEEQWWIMWRRVAGGLTRAQQESLFEKIFPALRKGEASPEQYLLAASLERVDMGQKLRLGQHLTQQIVAGRQQLLNQRIWALARIASRVPLYGGPETVVRPEAVLAWFEELRKLRRGEAAYAKLPLFLSQAGRLVLDREYDLPLAAREAFVAKMQEAGATPEQLRVVQEYVPVDASTRTQLFGESLPVGLVLAESLA